MYVNEDGVMIRGQATATFESPFRRARAPLRPHSSRSERQRTIGLNQPPLGAKWLALSSVKHLKGTQRRADDC